MATSHSHGLLLAGDDGDQERRNSHVHLQAVQIRPGGLVRFEFGQVAFAGGVQMSLAGGVGGSAGTIGAAGVVSCCGETQAARCRNKHETAQRSEQTGNGVHALCLFLQFTRP